MQSIKETCPKKKVPKAEIDLIVFDLLQASDSLLFVDLLYFGSANVKNATHLHFIVRILS